MSFFSVKTEQRSGEKGGAWGGKWGLMVPPRISPGQVIHLPVPNGGSLWSVLTSLTVPFMPDTFLEGHWPC